ncbi:MAG: hypothetical protein NTV00_02145 [Methylococcales bacterium]|nr:hypothetical protein [Methylococcales bacterium]
MGWRQGDGATFIHPLTAAQASFYTAVAPQARPVLRICPLPHNNGLTPLMPEMVIAALP